MRYCGLPFFPLAFLPLCSHCVYFFPPIYQTICIRACLNPCVPPGLPAHLRLLGLKFYPEEVLQCGQTEPDSSVASGVVHVPNRKTESGEIKLYLYSPRQASWSDRQTWSHEELPYGVCDVMHNSHKCHMWNSHSMTTRLHFHSLQQYDSQSVCSSVREMESYKGSTTHWFTLEQQFKLFSSSQAFHFNDTPSMPREGAHAALDEHQHKCGGDQSLKVFGSFKLSREQHTTYINYWERSFHK